MDMDKTVGAKSATGPVILVAENDPAVRKFIALALKPFGYELLVADTGEEAIEIARAYQGAIHVLLLGSRMLGMDWLTLATRSQQGRPDVRVVLMASHCPAPEIMGGLRVRFLQKPFLAAHLRLAIAESLVEG